MKPIIKNLFSSYGDICFIEFEINGKTKILNLQNFENRFGNWRQYK